jgi:glutaminyl-peptide cyclotransferase
MLGEFGHDRVTRVVVSVITVITVLTSCASAPADEPSDGVLPLRAEVLGSLPHDRTAYTQGLEFADGVLYESTGLVGRSGVRALDPTTGRSRESVALTGDEFGEGITVVGITVWQLTWKTGQAIRRDRDSLAERDRVAYQGEGWGLCHRRGPDRLVMSDGSDRLTFRDPSTFAPVGEVSVRYGGRALSQLNELECVDDAVWANIWQSDRIVRINPNTGQVTGVVDLSSLAAAQRSTGGEVLNGIAAVPGTDEFLITGKLWSTMYRVRMVPA